MKDTTTATVETRSFRGHYVAGIDGPEPGKFGIRRTWQTPRLVKSRRVNVWTLEPGWYERQEVLPKSRRDAPCETCQHQEDGKRREYFAVTPAGEVETLPASATAHIDRISAGPLPGEPGTWAGAWCYCGGEVDEFDQTGFPFCDEHAPTLTGSTDTKGLVA